MKGLYESLAQTIDGARLLARERLQYSVLKLLHKALRQSEMSQAALAAKLGVRKSAVNAVFRGDGNVRTSTLADYLHAMGYEANIELVPAGEPRKKALEEIRNVRSRKKIAVLAERRAPAVGHVQWRGDLRSGRKRLVSASMRGE